MTVPHLVALDVDGTTINHAGELSQAVQDAVRDVVAAGHHVIIATGRSIVATMIVLDQLGIDTGYAVCSNGAVTLELDPRADRGFRVIEAVTFDYELDVAALAEPDTLFGMSPDWTSLDEADKAAVVAEARRMAGERAILPIPSTALIAVARR